jgi:hypothetical protein
MASQMSSQVQEGASSCECQFHRSPPYSNFEQVLADHRIKSEELRSGCEQ